MKTIDSIKIGDSASFTKTVTETDIILYAGISGDFNPAHIDSEHAKGSMFGQRIAHGMLSASFISNVLGTQLPGPGTIYMGQELRFVKPVVRRGYCHRHCHRHPKNSGKKQTDPRYCCDQPAWRESHRRNGHRHAA